MSTFVETDHPRDNGGRFTDKPHSAPEVALGDGPVIVNSPASDRDANLWVRLDDGQTVTFNVSDAGIGQPDQPWRPDELTLARDGDEVRSIYSVTDDALEAELAAAFVDLDEAAAEELRQDLRREVIAKTGGRADVIFSDDGVEFRHTGRHERDSDGGVFTSNVMSRLEADQAYIYLRDGYYQLSAYAVLDRHGFGA